MGETIIYVQDEIQKVVQDATFQEKCKKLILECSSEDLDEIVYCVLNNNFVCEWIGRCVYRFMQQDFDDDDEDPLWMEHGAYEIAREEMFNFLYDFCKKVKNG